MKSIPGGVWLAGFSALLAAACGAGDPATGAAERDTTEQPRALYIGSLEGTDAKVAVVRSDGRWAAYACGGPSTLDTVTTWFEGTLDSAVADVGAASESGARLEMTLTEDRTTGVVTHDGNDAPFVAQRVEGRALAGLFQLVDGGCRTGLILPPPGEGAPQGVYCADVDSSDSASSRIFEQVTPLLPITSERSVTARVDLGSEARILKLRPVTLPLDAS
jgi:hypothetical protein